MKIVSILVLVFIQFNKCHTSSYIQGVVYEVKDKNLFSDTIKKLERGGYINIEGLKPLSKAMVYTTFIPYHRIPDVEDAMGRGENLKPYIDKYVKSIEYSKLIFTRFSETDKFGCFQNQIGYGGPPGDDLIILKIVKQDKNTTYYAHYYSKEKISVVGILISNKDSILFDSPKEREYLSLCDK